MKILLIHQNYPDTFWSFKYALKFISKKASFPPLGLLTVAAMLPDEWEKRLIDMNVVGLTDDDLKWADYVFISAMIIQKKSVKEQYQYWKLIIWTLVRRPYFIGISISFAIYGFHFRKIEGI